MLERMICFTVALEPGWKRIDGRATSRLQCNEMRAENYFLKTA